MDDYTGSRLDGGCDVLQPFLAELSAVNRVNFLRQMGPFFCCELSNTINYNATPEFANADTSFVISVVFLESLASAPAAIIQVDALLNLACDIRQNFLFVPHHIY